MLLGRHVEGVVGLVDATLAQECGPWRKLAAPITCHYHWELGPIRFGIAASMIDDRGMATAITGLAFIGRRPVSISKTMGLKEAAFPARRLGQI